MSETCPKCGAAKELGGGWRCGSWSSLMGFAEQGEHCRDRCQLAALTQRAEQAERERDESVRELKLCENFQLLKLTAAESEVKRLREGIEACNPNRFFVHSGSDLAYIWDRLSALLAQPSDGKDNPNAQ